MVSYIQIDKIADAIHWIGTAIIIAAIIRGVMNK